MNQHIFRNGTPLEERLWARVDRMDRAQGECWIWFGGTPAKQRYGQIVAWGRRQMVHRVVYQLLVGPIPDGMELDHICKNTKCVNPTHLEPVTHRVNVLRGDAPGAKRHRATHCKAGHEFTPENIGRERGRRICLTCRRAYENEYWKRRRAEARSLKPVPTHCKRGHPWDEGNTRWRNGSRICRACNRESCRQWNAAHRKAKAAS